MTIHEKVTPEQLDALYHRTLTVRQLAKDLGYSESWVGKALPARKPRRDPKLLRKTRIEFQNQIVERYLNHQISAKQAAAQAFTSPRTFFRRLKAYKNAQS
jgi:AraC-like DNA-binding protein